MTPITSSLHPLGDTRIELLLSGNTFAGIGRIWIGETLVRSGRLPLTIRSTSFGGKELRGLGFLGAEESAGELRVRLQTLFSTAETKLMRDHSFDPIHESGDWDATEAVADGELDIVFKPTADSFNNVVASGFAYHYEYRGGTVELFHLLEKSSWELDGDIRGATVVSQSSCSDPLVTIGEETAWTTEGLIHWDPTMPNPVMTHNLPRWASHQAFDFQWKNGRVLLGVFERVDLIRSLLRREKGAAELKTFDKHIFDQARRFSTVPKKILLAGGITDETEMQNLWTWTIDEVHERARAEFGLRKEPVIPRLGQNLWVNFNFESYLKDLIPAAAALGFKQVFIDNVNKSAMTEGGIGNMCCGHEYEPAPSLGGIPKLKELVDRASSLGIQVMSWTNNDQAYSSPLNASERDARNWYVKSEDTRTKYGGAYTNVFSIFDFANEEPRRLWIDSLKKNRENTGLNGYLFDSFYNLGFMPVNYTNGRPSTMWRQLLSAFKELQEADVHFLIESFGPFGRVQHGCPSSYSIDRCWVCFEIGVGNNYTTVPTALSLHEDLRADAYEYVHYILAHKTDVGLPLHKEGKRADEIWTPEHKRVLADYHEVLPLMKTRYLQKNGKCIIWHNDENNTAVIWSFDTQEARLPGTLFDVTLGKELPPADSHTLLPQHTYTLKAEHLPLTLG